MNRPPETAVNVREERLLTFAAACLEKAGSPPAQARAVARLLVDSDLRGVRSHGCRALNGYCGALESGKLNPDPRPSVIHETPAVVALDGDGGLGYVPMLEATDMAVARARELGLGMATVRSIGHYGSAGHYCRRAAATRILADYQTGAEFDALIPMIPAAFFKSVGYTAVASLMGGGLAGITEADPATAERFERYRREGIPFGPGEQESVRGAGARLGVSLPWDED